MKTNGILQMCLRACTKLMSVEIFKPKPLNPDPLMPIGQDSGWVEQLIWKLNLNKKKTPCLCRELKPDSSTVHPTAYSLYWQILCKFEILYYCWRNKVWNNQLICRLPDHRSDLGSGSIPNAAIVWNMKTNHEDRSSVKPEKSNKSDSRKYPSQFWYTESNTITEFSCV